MVQNVNTLVYDPDWQATVTLSVNYGTLRLADASGLTDYQGDRTRIMTLTGTLDALNAALQGQNVVYLGDANYNSGDPTSIPADTVPDDTLTITIDDLGNTDILNRDADLTNDAAPLAATSTVPITVDPTQDAPEFPVVPGPQQVLEDTELQLPAIGVFDVDARSRTTDPNVFEYDPDWIGEVTLTVQNGTVWLDDPTGVTYSVVSNREVILTGSLDALNNAQRDQNVRYLPDQDFNSNHPTLPDEELVVAFSDLGNTVGSELVTKVTIPIDVVSVNDPPSFELPNADAPPVTVDPGTGSVTVTVDEDAGTVSVVPFASNIKRGPDSAADEVVQGWIPAGMFQVTVTSTTGTLDFDPANGGLWPAITAPPIGQTTGDLSFRASPDTNGTAIVEVRLQDDGGTALGGVDITPVHRFTIVVNPIEDVPEFTLGLDPVVQEDAGLRIFEGWASDIRPGPVTATDEAGQTLTFTLDVEPAVPPTGDVTFAVAPTIDELTGDLTFEATADSNGQVNVKVTLRDGMTLSGGGPSETEATFTITVDRVNDAPIAVNDGSNPDLTTPEDTALDIQAITLLGNDLSGPGNEDLGPRDDQTLQVVGLGSFDATTPSTATSATTALGGTVTLVDTNSDNEFDRITYEPAQDFFGQDTFTYTIEDNGQTGPDGALADDFLRAVGTVTLTVSPINDPPVPYDDPPADERDKYTVDEDTVLLVEGLGVLFNDVDPDSTTLMVSQFSATDYNAPVTFLPEGTAGPWTGSFTYDPIGTLVLQQLNIGQQLTDTFTYRAVDDQGAESVNPATVTVTINGVNDAPTSNDVAFTIEEGASQTTVSFDGDDIDLRSGEELVFTIVNGLDAGQGSLVNNGDGTFTFDPGTDFQDLTNASDTRVVKFSYRATDGEQAQSNLSTVTITVTGTNNPPTTNDITISVAEKNRSTASFDGDDADSDDDATTLTYTMITGLGSGEGSVVNNGDGTFTYDPGTDFTDLAVGDTRQVSFRYEATDSHNDTSNESTVTVVVVGVNDAPTVSTVSAPAVEDGGMVIGSFPGDDMDSDDNRSSLTYSIVSGVPAGMGSLINRGNGTFTYYPGRAFQDLNVGDSQAVTFRYRAEDRHGALSNIAVGTITVTGRNDVPGANSISLEVGENAAILSAAFDGTDVDDDVASLRYDVPSGVGVGQGTLTNKGDGTFSFDPGTDFDGLAVGERREVIFTYEAVDPHGDKSLIRATVTLTVVGANDAPEANDVSGIFAVEDGAAVAGALLGDDIDSNDDPDSLTYNLVTFPPTGSGNVTKIGRRSFTFNPGSDFQNLGVNQTVDVTFTYSVADRFSENSSTLGTVTVTVGGVNDAPTVDNVSGTTTDEASTANGDLVGQDVDDDESGSGLTYAILAGPGKGIVTLSGNPGDTEFTFDPNGQFESLAANQQEQVSFTYRATDTHGDRSGAGTVTITVTGLNDAPVAGTVTANVPEDSGPAAGNFSATDLDSDENGSGLTYNIESPPLLGSVQNSGNPGDPAFRYDPQGQFDHLIAGQTQTVTFTYSASDQQGGTSNVADVTITIDGANDAPVANDVRLDVEADGSQGLLDASDADGDEDGSGLTYLLAGAPDQGAVTLSGVPGDATFTFDPGSDFDDLPEGQTRQVDFTYQARDLQNALSNLATVDVTVTGVNDAPTAGDVAIQSRQGGSTVTASFAADDVDSDDSPGTLSYAVIDDLSLGEGSVVNNADGTFTFDPGSDFQDLGSGQTRSVTFTYQATDRFNATSNPGIVTVVVSGMSDLPFAQNVSVTASPNAPTTASFDATDVDDDGALQYRIVQGLGPNQGRVVNENDGTFTFDPGDDFIGLALGERVEVTFSYVATDPQGGESNEAVVTLAVTGINERPTAANVTLVVDEDGPDVTGVFRGDDVDSDDDASTLTYEFLTAPSAGQVVNHDDSTFTFSPAGDFEDLAEGQVRTVSMRYTARDRHLAGSDSATITVNVVGANDNPVAVDDTAATDEGEITFVSALDNDSDPDTGDGFSISNYQAITAQGAFVVLQGGVFRYDPTSAANLNDLDGGQKVTDSFTYTIEDIRGAQATGTVFVTVSGVFNPPVAEDDDTTARANQTRTVAAPGVLENDSDPDPSDTVEVATAGDFLSDSGAAVSLTTDGGFSYDPAGVADFVRLDDGEVQQDTFTYLATDGTALSNRATVTVTVEGVNDAPVAADDTYITEEDATLNVSAANGVLQNDFDPDAETLSVVPMQQSGLTLNADGSFSYTPAADFNGSESFPYTVSDGDAETTATLTMVVTAVNDAPVAVDDEYTTDPGVQLAVSVAEGVLQNDTDIDDTNRTAQLVNGTSNGALDPADDGSFTYTPNPGFSGEDSFTYRALDDEPAASNVATVTITVGSGNPWHNRPFPQDTNNDGSVSPVDALIIINELNINGARALPIPPVEPFVPPPFYDVNDDGFLTPVDAVIVINFLNEEAGEGEFSAGGPVLGTDDPDLLGLDILLVSDAVLARPAYRSAATTARLSSSFLLASEGSSRELPTTDELSAFVGTASERSAAPTSDGEWESLLTDLALEHDIHRTAEDQAIESLFG
ncbi:MAG: Ig-like domain-containing protein [Pirellulales bacterium]